jgi:hypothetical protein
VKQRVQRCTLKLGYSRPSLFMGLHIAILRICGRIIMETLVHCRIGLACTVMWSSTCLLHSETRCGHQGNILVSYFPKARKISLWHKCVSFPEDIYSPEGDRRGPDLTLEYVPRIWSPPALRLPLSQKFFELSCMGCLTFILYCY